MDGTACTRTSSAGVEDSPRPHVCREANPYRLKTDPPFEDATIPAIEPAEPASIPSADPIPAVFRHYILDRRADGSLWQLGRGGMGVTYKATDMNLRCAVALKIIGPQCFGGESSRHRFVHEARLAAQIRHPNVAAVHHLESEGDEIFYAMEFVDGITAEEWVKGRGVMSAELALDVAMQVARALTAADRLELVHRDIKPGNIMLLADPADSARVIVKVIDFGLARSALFESSPLVTTCAFVGTPQYASPEQIESARVDIRSDIYSLGCVLWFLLIGEPPFTGSHARVMANHLTAEPPYARLERLPAPIVSLLRSMLAKDPKDRPETPVALHALIRECRASLPREHNGAQHPRNDASPVARLAALRPSRLAVLWALSLAVFATVAWLAFFAPDAPQNSHSRPAPVPGIAIQPPVIPEDRGTRALPIVPIAATPPPAIAAPQDVAALQVPGLDNQEPVPPASTSAELPQADDPQETEDAPPPGATSSSASQDNKPAAKATPRPRKSTTADRRSTTPETLQRVQRSIRGFFNRIF